MKIKYLFPLFLCVVGSLVAQTSSKEAVANLPFTGVYRAGAKTSIARSSLTVFPIVEYQNLPALLATLPKDSVVRSKHPALKQIQLFAPPRPAMLSTNCR
jgi:hypothetical protein